MCHQEYCPRSAKMSVHEPEFSFSCACVLAQSNVQDFDIFNIFKLEDLCKINYKLRGLM